VMVFYVIFGCINFTLMYGVGIGSLEFARGCSRSFTTGGLFVF